MKTFKDNKGQEWDVAVTVASAETLRDTLNIDILTFGKEEDPASARCMPMVVHRLEQDVSLLVDVLFVICQRQARERGVSDEAFGHLLGGESLDQAATALQDEILAFTRDPNARKTLVRVIQRFRKRRDQVMKELDESLSETELDRLEKREMHKTKVTSGTSSGGAPESSD